MVGTTSGARYTTSTDMTSAADESHIRELNIFPRGASRQISRGNAARPRPEWAAKMTSAPRLRQPADRRASRDAEARSGQVRVKVEACGLWHTDLHAANGDWPIKPSPPFIPGHEGVGVVTQLGFGVSEVAVGDRVAMPWLGYACGSCDYCVSGREALCLNRR